MLMSDNTNTNLALTKHVPVLLAEVIASLKAFDGGLYLDCTLGGGGHTESILKSDEKNRVIAVDRDLRAIERAKLRLAKYIDRVTFVHSRFSQIKNYVEDLKFDGILADLGMSTDQLNESRGFSFNDFNKFDMRMDETQGASAQNFLSTKNERDLIKLLKEGGVGQEARRIAEEIVRVGNIESSAHFTKIILKAAGPKYRPSDIVPVVFQAIRIAVNNEYNEIRELLTQIPKMSKSGTRVVVISFHSLEDKEVTKVLRRWHNGEEIDPRLRQIEIPRSLGKLLTKKALVPSTEEIVKNPSARSARARVFEFI